MTGNELDFNVRRKKAKQSDEVAFSKQPDNYFEDDEFHELVSDRDEDFDVWKHTACAFDIPLYWAVKMLIFWLPGLE